MTESIAIDGLTVMRALPQGRPRRNVLFVHGQFAGAGVWEAWLPFFAGRGFGAYALDLRGRGQSRPVPDLGRVSVRDYVEDACLVARHLGKPAVVGHSMGGLIAQALAADDMVNAAVLITPAPPRGIPLFAPRLLLKQLKYLPATLLSRTLDPGREDLRGIVMNRMPRERQDYYLERLVADSGRAAREMSITGVPVDRHRVRCPLRIFTATDDRFVPPRIVRRIARRYGIAAEDLTDHGHMVIAEPGWETLAGTIASWLDEHDVREAIH
jgi:non-heme chloroperoxidase